MTEPRSASWREARGQPRALSGLLPFLRPYRWQVALAGLFLLLAAGTTLAFPMALRQLVDAGLAAPDRGQQLLALRGHFALLFGVAVLLGLFSALRFFTVTWLGERVTADLRQAVYAHVLQQPPAYFETTQTGEVLSRLTTDTTLVQTVVGSSLSLGLRNSIMGLGALAMLVWTNPGVMVQVALVIGLVVLPAAWAGRRVRRLSRASQDRVADTSAVAAEVLGAIPVVQSYTAEPREVARFAQASESAFGTALKRTRVRAALVAFLMIGTSGALLWGLYQGTQAVIAGRLSAGALGQTVLYVLMLAGAFGVLGEVWGELLRAAGATERLMELLHDPIGIVSEPNAVPVVVEASAPAIEFAAVGFHYPSRPTQAALDGVSFSVAVGETVALVGASGAGKSTVFQLLERFFDPQAGAVRVGGIDVREARLTSLREQMATVAQDALIFSATARENIRYGRPGASDADVEAAARAAHADGFLRALPEGYDTFLGERGVRLSGGQRQRLSIARALVKNAPILLLDEATSALDAESERQVQAALDDALTHERGDDSGTPRTTLVIAHRLATVRRASRILVFEAGRIVEEGTHAALLARGGVYARLAALQFKEHDAQTASASQAINAE